MPKPKAPNKAAARNGKTSKPPLTGAPDAEKKVQLINTNTYKELKRRAFEFEKTNKDSIVIFPAKGDGTWYKMGGNSALFYMRYVMGRLHLSANYRDDTDYCYVFDLGTITVRNLELIQKRMERADVLKEVIRGGGSYRYKLKFSHTEKEIEDLRREELFRRERLSKIIEPSFMNPELYVNIAHLAKRCSEMASKRQDHFARSIYGRELVAAANTLFEEYLMMTSIPKENTVENWRKLSEQAVRITVKLQIISELKLWPQDKCAVIGKEAIEINRSILSEAVSLKDRLTNKAKLLEKK